MSTEIRYTEIDLISRLGCMRRNTVIKDSNLGSIEHIELWVPKNSGQAPGSQVQSPVRLRPKTKQAKGPIR